MSELLTIDDLAARFKLSVDHVRDRVVKLAGFPAPVMIGRTRRWRKNEIEAYEDASRAVERRGPGRPRRVA